MFLKNSKGAAVAGNVVTDIVSKDTQISQFLYGHITLTTDATVANRRVIISVVDTAGTVVMESHAGAVVAASTASQHHDLFQGIFRETTFVGGSLQMPVPVDFIIPPGYSTRITIENGVAGVSYDYAFIYKVDHATPDEVMVD